ncbi:MAG: glycosyltransferase [Clostridia bacterium]|nr:glycosyltransferase [Clostridia bacterium]
MKTILQVTGTMDRGGAEMMLMDLVRQLHKDFCFKFLVVTKKGSRPKGDFDEELKSLGIEIYYIDAVWDVGVKEFSRQFKLIVEQIGHIDVVHSHLNSKGGIISKCAAKAGIKKIIVHSHAKLKFDGSIVSKIANYTELYIQRYWINKYATDYWACSKEALSSLFTKKHCECQNAQVIHNAIDLEKFSRYSGETIRDELNIPNDAFVIGTVGRIAKVKNYEFAADVIKALWDRGFDCHYVVAGRKQSESSANYLFEKLSNDPHFHYVGVCEDLPALYHSFDLYLGTSLREGLGLTAVEAQASGVNCVLSSGFPTLCDVGANLVSFVEGNDPIKWADYIINNYSEIKIVDTNEIENAVRNSGFDILAEAVIVKEIYNS